jgi:hypothetical protein
MFEPGHSTSSIFAHAFLCFQLASNSAVPLQASLPDLMRAAQNHRKSAGLLRLSYIRP